MSYFETFLEQIGRRRDTPISPISRNRELNCPISPLRLERNERRLHLSRREAIKRRGNEDIGYNKSLGGEKARLVI